MRWAAFVLAAVLVLAAGMGSAQAPPVKLALVIGNADYDGGGIDVTPQGIAESTAGGYVPDLRNPINDANDVGDALKRIGFSVTTVLNGDGPTMSAALATFGTKVAEAPDTAQVVIYYAGHAMQVDGVNYLIPARARLPQVDFSRMPSRNANGLIASVTVPIERVMDQFREPRAPGVNLLILDACRDNPWDSRVRGLTRNAASNVGGLAQVPAPTRTIVSFSTALNRKAQDGGERDRNSPFAAALKEAIGKPGTITEMLDGVGTAVEASTSGRQSPWYQSASVGQVCLASCVRGAVVPETVDRPFELETLAPTVAANVRKARDIRLLSQQAASKAQRAAEVGDQIAARLERNGTDRGSVAMSHSEVNSWEQTDDPIVHGVNWYLEGPVQCDSYSGEVESPALVWFGVYRFCPNRPNTLGALRFEGENYGGTLDGIGGESRTGLGRFIFRDRSTYEGQVSQAAPNGLGVLVRTDGTRLEGSFVNGRLDGLGVEWSPNGLQRRAGTWRLGQLVASAP